MYTKILTGAEARQKITNGVTIINDVVSKTMGARGRTTIIRKQNGAHYPTKDGMLSARDITLLDKMEDTGANLIKEVCINVVNEAGDSSTCASVITASLIKQINEILKKDGVNPHLLKEGMESALKFISDTLTKMAIPAKDENGEIIEKIVRQVAFISSNGDNEIADVVTEAVVKVKDAGLISIEPSQGGKMEVLKEEGVILSSGSISPFFYNHATKQRCELERPFVLLYDRTIDKLPKQFIELLQAVAATGNGLFIVCEDLKDEGLATLIRNKMDGRIKCCVVKLPSFGADRMETMNDIAIVTGTKFYTESIKQLKDIKIEHLGRAEKIIIDKNQSLFVLDETIKEKQSLAITNRIQNLKEYVDDEANTDAQQVRQRLAKLTGGVATIKVGGVSDAEVKERKDRVDDAWCAVRSAIECGFVAGGGSELLKIGSNTYINDDIGGKIMMEAIQMPFKTIMANAGMSGEEITKLVVLSDLNFGYNLSTNKIENLVDAGVIDAVKGIICALKNAVSIAGTFATIESFVCFEQ